MTRTLELQAIAWAEAKIRDLQSLYPFSTPIDYGPLADAYLAGARDMREMAARVADANANDAFLYERRDADNRPGSLDIPRNAYNAFLAMAKIIRKIGEAHEPA